jgi:hypothetical protein
MPNSRLPLTTGEPERHAPGIGTSSMTAPFNILRWTNSKDHAELMLAILRATSGCVTFLPAVQVQGAGYGAGDKAAYVPADAVRGRKEDVAC